MAVVIAVMWVAARFLKGREISNGRSTFKFGTGPKRSLLQVIARQGVGRRATVTVVRAGDKALVLGITDQNISLLAELSDVDLEKVQEVLEPQGTGASLVTANAETSTARTGLLTQLRERTVRKA